MSKRIISILLTLCIVICLLPTGIFAEGETVKKVETEQELVDALADNTVDIITLNGGIEASTALTVDRKVTLDLNGHVLKMIRRGSVIILDNNSGTTGDRTKLTLTGGKASFDIDPNKKAYIYIRVTDASGNITVINSDGIVVYTDAEAITEAVNFTMLDSNDVIFNVNLNGNTVKALYNGDLVIESGSYEVAAEHNLSVSRKPFNLFCIGTDSHKSQIIKYLIF